MAGGMGGVRPPPPEYKAAAQAQMMHAGIGMGQQARFPNAGPMRRVTQQPMPPSGEFISPNMKAHRFQIIINIFEIPIIFLIYSKFAGAI